MKRAMDVVLLKPVESLGSEGAVVHVKPGFARNYLIPSGLAAEATPQQRKALEARQQARARQAQRQLAQAGVLKAKLERLSLTLSLAVGTDDKPFGSVTAHDVVDALAREGLTIEKHAIQLDEPIKTLGTIAVPVRLHADVSASLKVRIIKA